jgi:hypothetical protein
MRNDALSFAVGHCCQNVQPARRLTRDDDTATFDGPRDCVVARPPMQRRLGWPPGRLIGEGGR